MKFFRITVLAAFACAVSLFLGGCAKEELSGGGKDYGYVQFKLYKENAYNGVKSKAVSEIEQLADVSKIQVSLEKDGQTITQTLTLSAADKNAAEFGLRSEKLSLLKGEYKFQSFILYDGVDEPLYNGTPVEPVLTVVPGGMTMVDVTCSAASRGWVRFVLDKDLSAFQNNPSTKAIGSDSKNRQYIFEEIKYVDIKVREKGGVAATFEFEDIPCKYTTHFISEDADGNPVGEKPSKDDPEYGYQTSTVVCDSLVSIKGGEYEVVAYATKDEDKLLLETHNLTDAQVTSFVVGDLQTVDAKVKVSLYETDGYIKDYYALYQIWKDLDGKHWSYYGENFTIGTNWDFKRDPDLWGAQPGVEIHENGRVAKIDLSGFGVKGVMPKALGNLTELVELVIDTHNEEKKIYDNPSAGKKRPGSIEERGADLAKFMADLHPQPSASPIVAWGWAVNGEKNLLDNSPYSGYTADELMGMVSGMSQARPQARPRLTPKDMNRDEYTNGFLGFEEGCFTGLKKLETFYLANSPIKDKYTGNDGQEHDSFPSDFSSCYSLKDVEVYNCSGLTELPAVFGQISSLYQLNFSNNGWGEASLETLAKGRAKDNIQVLYFVQNDLEKIPESVGGMSRLGMLDLAYNKISGTVKGFGDTFRPAQVVLDYNNIEAFDGAFCKVEDMESFSCNYNKLKVFPNIFDAGTEWVMTSISFAFNQIESFPADFKGVNVETLTLSGNKLKKYPVEIAGSGSMITAIVLSGNYIEEFPEGCFDYENALYTTTFDFTYNNISEYPKEFHAGNFPYLTQIDMSYNNFSKAPLEPLDALKLTTYGLRGQRDSEGEPCLKEWVPNVAAHTGLRGLFLGDNDIRKVTESVSYICYNLDIAGNPDIQIDLSSICSYWKAGLFILYYDKSQTGITGCPELFE